MKEITEFICPLLSGIENGKLIEIKCIGNECVSFRNGEYRDGCMIFSTECWKKDG